MLPDLNAAKSNKGMIQVVALFRATMIVSLIERNNIVGLAKEIVLRKNLPALAFNKLPGKLG